MTPFEAIMDEFEAWRRERLAHSAFSCRPIPFAASQEWYFENGRLRHRTGGFFAVAGVRVEANDARLDGREQIILDQRQPALIGLAIVPGPEGARLLMQGRIEPGNVAGLQLAPTVQSTRANYERMHGGRATAYLNLFTDSTRDTLLDEMQAEEGSRYLLKFNRTVAVVATEAEAELVPGFRLISLNTLRVLIVRGNWINTDARSILACLDWDVLARPRRAFAGEGFAAALRTSLGWRWQEIGLRETVGVLAGWQARANPLQCLLQLGELRGWEVGPDRIASPDGNLFVHHYKVAAADREVPGWDQPLVGSVGHGCVVLVAQRRGGVLRFLLRATYEIGLRGGVAFGPGYARAPGEREGEPISSLDTWVLRIARDHELLALRQSEEGGRFYQEENDYVLAVAPDDDMAPEDGEARWLTLGEVKDLTGVSGVSTIELRVACSMLLAWL